MEVEVYGVDHSPWVQAVLLTLHHKGIDYRLRSLPPWQVLKTWGVLMPAVSINEGAWQVESAEILVKLGLEPISAEDLQSVKAAWQGVLHRPDSLLGFFSAFARAGDVSPSLIKRAIGNFGRSFIALYMFTLINFTKRVMKPQEPKNFGDQFLAWERILQASSRSFLDGEAPGIRDMMLFGVIQCHSSIPVPPLTALQRDERLNRVRKWIAHMQAQFNDYPYLYSCKYFEPYSTEPKAADATQRILFYAGLLAMILAAPLTIPLVFLLMSKVPR